MSFIEDVYNYHDSCILWFGDPIRRSTTKKKRTKNNLGNPWPFSRTQNLWHGSMSHRSMGHGSWVNGSMGIQVMLGKLTFYLPFIF